VEADNQASLVDPSLGRITSAVSNSSQSFFALSSSLPYRLIGSSSIPELESLPMGKRDLGRMASWDFPTLPGHPQSS
jgi:hypothetical protein